MIKEYFENIFLYHENKPLLFTQLYFWGFFAIVLLFYSIIYKKRHLRNAYLFFVSLFFYYKTSGFFFFILLFSTFSDYFIGHRIYRSQTKVKKKLWVALSVFLNLGVLCYFKYAYFYTESYNQLFQTDYEVINHLAYWANSIAGTTFQVNKILLPVGISFYTFQTISYSVDVYREKIKPVGNILDFGFYVSFFPQLVAGPIVRAADFVPQLYKKYSLTAYEFGLASYWILKGLVKKMFVGDYIAVNLIDRVFANPSSYTGFENLMGLYGYSLQVYCDFSGYTDIAIGVALLMGFRLPTNFNSPYKAKNVGEFWKRWHISLSSWLRDYLYIPMGGNRHGSVFTWISLAVIMIFLVFISGVLWLVPVFAIIVIIFVILANIFPKLKRTITTNINTLMTMLLGGLWHGASWMFVLWGGLNGIGLLIYKFWRKISPWENSKLWIANFWKIFITFNFITFTRIWFRGESMPKTYALLHQVGNNFGFDVIGEMIASYGPVFLMMLFGFVMHWLPSGWKSFYRNFFIKSPVYVKVVVCILAVFAIYQVRTADLQPFIYFQF